jgi:hypothetical protein
MKLFASFLLVIFAFALFSCSDDDDDNNNNTVTLEGTSWQKDVLVGHDIHVTRIDFKSDSFDFVWPNGAPEDHKNSTVKITYGTYNFTITEDAECPDIEATYSWGIDEPVLALATDGDDCQERLTILMGIWTRMQ